MVFDREQELDVMSGPSPSILAGIDVTLMYIEASTKPPLYAPWAGLEEPTRLVMSKNHFRY
jgi:hypothetical protein